MNPQRRVILVVLAFALALVSLDNTIVNVALPRLQEDLGASTSALQWIIDAYSVVFAGTLLLAGSLGDRFGRRRMLIIGLTIFIVASTLAAISPDAAALTACRGLMGFGAAFIMPSTLSILVSTFTNSRERGQAIGIWAAVAGAGVAVGPIVGGLLLEHFSWHSIFWVNPPIAACVLIATLVFVPESKDPSRPRLDLFGAALSAGGVVALTVTVIEVPDLGLSGTTITTLVLAIALLSAFVWREQRAVRPMLPMTLFADRRFSTSIVIVGLVYFALMGAMFFLPQFLQLVQGMSPLESGFAVLPGALGMLIASLFSAPLGDRLGSRRLVMTGLSIVTAGLMLFSAFTATTPYAFVGITFAVMGAGLGLTLPQATNAVLGSVPAERAGMGSAVNDAVGELGGSFGVALLGAAMSITYRQDIESAITAAGAQVNQIPDEALAAARDSLAAASVAASQVPESSADAFTVIAGQAFVSGMAWALFIGAGITALGILLAWRRFPITVATAVE